MKTKLSTAAEVNTAGVGHGHQVEDLAATRAEHAVACGRESVDLLLERARWLAPPDRSLIHAVYDRGLAPAEVAAFLHQQARTVRNRLRRLMARVNTRPFLYVLARRQSMPPRRKRVGELVILQGATERDAARLLGLTAHQVRSEVLRLRTLAEEDPALDRHGHESTAGAQS